MTAEQVVARYVAASDVMAAALEASLNCTAEMQNSCELVSIAALGEYRKARADYEELRRAEWL